MAADENGGGGADARLSVYAHCAMASCPAGLAAAGLVLQVCLAASLASLAASLAAAGPLQGRYTRPSFNGAAAVKCFFLSSSFLFFLRGFKQEQKYYRVAIWYSHVFTLVLPIRDWSWLKGV